MKVLLDINNKVMDTALNGEFIITETLAQIKEGNNIRLTYGGYNSSNCSVIDIIAPTEPISGKIYDSITNTFKLDPTDPNVLPIELELENGPESGRINYTLKKETRKIINNEVGDTLDQTANTDKKITLIMPVAVRTFLLLIDLYTQLNLVIPETILPLDKKQIYIDYCNNYLTILSNGYVDRIDVDPDIANTIQRIFEFDGKLAEVVKTNYLDKKV